MAKNKTIRKFSKTTIGRSVDTVADYVDILSQMVAEYFNQKYKVEKKVEEIKKATLNTLYALKREFMKSVIEAVLLSTGLLALVLGVILLLARVVPIEYILVGYGMIVVISVLARLKVQV